MAPITRTKADEDAIEDVVNNKAGTVRNQAPNLEALIATQIVYTLEDLINRVLAIEGMLKTSTMCFSHKEGELCPRMTNKERERERIISKEKPNNQSND
jgi:ribosomal protein S30